MNQATGHRDGSSHVHEQFNASVAGADFIAQSSDGVIFHLHRKNLQLHTDGAFPGLGNESNAIAEKLDEPSSILEIVFPFMYPRRNSSPKNLEFQTILAVADAVQKYKVFAAMDVCEAALRVYLPDEGLPIFLHALKHRLADLIDQCAISLAREPVLSVLDQLPLAFTRPWLRYLEDWKRVFDTQLKKLEGAPYSSADSKCRKASTVRCSACLCSTFAWVSFLQRMDKLSDLKAALTATIDPRGLSPTYNFNIRAANLKGSFSTVASRFQYGHGSCRSCVTQQWCCFMDTIARDMLKAIENLPLFTKYLNQGEAPEEVIRSLI